jgi:hypothetical protein
MRELRRVFTYNSDEDKDPRMREVRRIFTNNCDEDEGSQDEGGEEDLYL